MDVTNQAMEYVEEMFVKYGATEVPSEGSDKSAALGLRNNYLRNGIYYRVESAAYEEGDVIMITATDNPAYASVGIQDNIAGFPAAYPAEKIEKEVRFAFEIEPYPESYPVY